MLAGVFLNGFRGAAVGVSLAQHRIDGAPLDPVIAGSDLLLPLGPGIVGILRKGIPLGLEFRNGRLELRDGGTDVRKLDDVRLRAEGQGTEFGKRVADPLLGLQEVGEIGDDAPGERDVTQLDGDPRMLRERLNDRQEGIGCQGGGLVGLGVEDGGLGHDPAEIKETGARNQSKRGLPTESVPLTWNNYGQNAS